MSIKIFSSVKKINTEQKIQHRLKSYNYSDSTKTLSQKIALEKRRRHQVYTLLDYALSVVTYFDFFSKDTFKIIEYAKYLAQSIKMKNLNVDDLF